MVLLEPYNSLSGTKEFWSSTVSFYLNSVHAIAVAIVYTSGVICLWPLATDHGGHRQKDDHRSQLPLPIAALIGHSGAAMVEWLSASTCSWKLLASW